MNHPHLHFNGGLIQLRGDLKQFGDIFWIPNKEWRQKYLIDCCFSSTHATKCCLNSQSMFPKSTWSFLQITGVCRALKSISNLMQHSTTAAIDTFTFKKSKKTTFGERLSGIRTSFHVRQLFEGFHWQEKKKSLFEGKPFWWFMWPLGKSFVPLIWQPLFFTRLIIPNISKQDENCPSNWNLIVEHRLFREPGVIVFFFSSRKYPHYGRKWQIDRRWTEKYSPRVFQSVFTVATLKPYCCLGSSYRARGSDLVNKDEHVWFNKKIFCPERKIWK